MIADGEGGIRTPASFYTPVGFRDRSLQPDLGTSPRMQKYNTIK